jgi:hypothetical protein
MKPLSLLLFTIVTLGGFGEAAPTRTELEKRVVNEGDPFPVLTTQVLAPQATSFQFYTSPNWRDDTDASKDQAAQGVLRKMNAVGLFTAVVLYSSKSSVVGASDGGLTTPDEYLKENSVESALITNGAFFITGTDNDLVSDFKDGQKGAPLPPAQYKGWSVGPTSLTKNTVGVPSVYADLYERFTADDRTFLYSGPDLKEPVDTTVPPQAQANTDAGRLQYFVRDGSGNRIPAPPPDNFVRTEFTHVPGGLVTANEQNERNVLVIVDASVKVVCAYTSSRNAGMTVNGMRDVIDTFLQGYLQGKTIETTEMALGLDGGRSVYVAWVKNGQTEVLAAGNLANPTQEPANFQLREVTTMLKHSVPVALSG